MTDWNIQLQFPECDVVVHKRDHILKAWLKKLNLCCQEDDQDDCAIAGVGVEFIGNVV